MNKWSIAILFALGIIISAGIMILNEIAKIS